MEDKHGVVSSFLISQVSDLSKRPPNSQAKLSYGSAVAWLSVRRPQGSTISLGARD